jgi:hypothetical protein
MPFDNGYQQQIATSILTRLDRGVLIFLHDMEGGGAKKIHDLKCDHYNQCKHKIIISLNLFINLNMKE